MANKNECLKEYCVLSNSEERHLRKEKYIEFNCKHYACVDCFLFWIEREQIKCNICNAIQTNVDSIIEKNKTTLLESMQEVLKNKESNERMNDRQSKIRNRIEFMTEEIDITIESLKCKLESFQKLFNEELDEIGVKLKQDEIDESLEEKCSNDLNELETLIKENFNKESIKQYGDKIKELENVFHQYKSKNGDEPIFLDSRMTFSKNDIGKFVIENKMDTEIINKIENEQEKIEVQSIAFNDIFIMPDGKILMTCKFKPEMRLYDEILNLLKIIIKTRIDNFKKFDFSCCAYDGDKSMFFTDYSSQSIMKTDLEFNVLETFYYSDIMVNSFNSLRGICYFNNQVFVCEEGDKCIIKFDSNLLTFKEVLNFDYFDSYRFIKIKNINHIALISLFADFGYLSCFYDLNNSTLIRINDNNNCSVGASLTKFYAYDFGRNILSCYDSNGQLYKNIEITSFRSLSRLPRVSSSVFDDPCIACHNSKMIFGIFSCLYII